MYIGTKLVEAKSMNRGEYNLYRGWQLPEDENPDDAGYLVISADGYETWTPKVKFEADYRSTDGMPFGSAIELMKSGFKVARKGWNGKGMFLYHVPANRYAATTKAGNEIAGDDGKVEYGAYIAMKTAQGNVVPWLASQTDMLAEDWNIVE